MSSESRLPSAQPFLSMQGINKSFGSAQVLRDVDFDIHTGEVRGLVGENGAGKSTLIKILSGLYTADSGTILIEGEPAAISSPGDAERLGIYVIHQDRHLAGRLTVAEQLYLGRDESRRGWVSRAHLNQRAVEDLRRTVGLEIPPRLLVDELTVAEQQLLQIARAVLAEPRLLVLDEPTAPLAAAEVDQLFGTIERLRDAGVPIIYISHYLQELRRISGTVTVLRNGGNAGEVDLTGDPRGLETVVELMVGGGVEEFEAFRPVRSPQDPTPALEVTGLAVPGALSDVDLDVRWGEIVGVTGLVGSGVDVLADAVTGNLPHAGTVRLGGKAIRSAHGFVQASGAYVPSDRRKNGALVRNTVGENISLVSLRTLTNPLGVIRRRQERKLAERLIGQLDIRPAQPDVLAGGLSGGNQQKTVLARWLAAGSRFLVLDQPTSGVDVGSRAQIYAQINRLVDDGAGVLLVTVDLEELVGLADRILVFYRGRIVAQLRGDEASTDKLLALASGADAQDTADTTADTIARGSRTIEREHA
ncbi:sugar ABC transporter ATP-binding protein [Arthrobacter burdickii]|uniref:Sugar ABC transporter ATP-binding protein n=1 Tax=Arthrobacter burdickii TaxID=3035920 RepID=A0ABT8JY91_9MICC|nr:sugar ABC transporter ATP-binding protein [Arthrobacter burdickii]MDN4609541.1 sugar ABC transporter ATP-binding protein [Arthrobacter burdickii]